MSNSGDNKEVAELLTEQEASQYLRMSQRRLYSLRKQGKIAYIRDGHRVKYWRMQLGAYLTENTVTVQEVH
ncbi:MAG: helix-turn-helix domain-containing protein [Planctomycetes bacterium]|jgi:excisionase family DNA binding protein|nr:helix-turn-helix domain-containing protein [Planctomycetota bacterium]